MILDRLGFPLALLAGLATASCALVSPLDDVTPDGDGDGADAGDAGAKPDTKDASASIGGKKKDAGATRDAGGGGSNHTDAGSDSGTQVEPDAGKKDAGPPPKCGDVIPGDAQLLRSCVLQASCDPYVPAFSISRCIHLNAQSATIAGFCTRTATTCDDVWQCLGRAAPLIENSPCGVADVGWRCDGNIATLCDPTLPQVVQVDCAYVGSACELYASGIVAPETVPCRAAVPVTCDEDANGRHCQANHVYTCIGNVPYGGDCARHAARCDDESLPDTAFCNELPACDEPGLSCNGDTLEQCDSSRSLARFDCTAVGNRCEEKGTQLAYCLPPGCTQADADTCEERCEGSVLKLCGNIELDCQDYGFSSCYEYTHPVTGENTVSCAL